MTILEILDESNKFIEKIVDELYTMKSNLSQLIFEKMKSAFRIIENKIDLLIEQNSLIHCLYINHQNLNEYECLNKNKENKENDENDENQVKDEEDFKKEIVQLFIQISRIDITDKIIPFYNSEKDILNEEKKNSCLKRRNMTKILNEKSKSISLDKLNSFTFLEN